MGQVHDVWKQKLDQFEVDRDQLRAYSAEGTMDQENSVDKFSGLLKLNLVLAHLKRSDQGYQAVIEHLGSASGFLSSIVGLPDRETSYFFVVYVILELLAILIEDNQKRLRMKSLLSDMRNELKLSQDAIGYYTGLFRLDELLIPFKGEVDEKALENRHNTIVRHSLK